MSSFDQCPACLEWTYERIPAFPGAHDEPAGREEWTCYFCDYTTTGDGEVVTPSMIDTEDAA